MKQLKVILISFLLCNSVVSSAFAATSYITPAISVAKTSF